VKVRIEYTYREDFKGFGLFEARRDVDGDGCRHFFALRGILGGSDGGGGEIHAVGVGVYWVRNSGASDGRGGGAGDEENGEVAHFGCWSVLLGLSMSVEDFSV
jgi:hypothetical protein